MEFVQEAVEQRGEDDAYNEEKSDIAEDGVKRCEELDLITRVFG